MSTPNPPSGGPPLRALAMVLIAVAIVFAGLGAMSLSKSESSGSQTTVAQAPTTTVPVSRPAVPAATSAPAVTSTTTTESSAAAEAPAAPTTTTAAPAAPPPPANPAGPVDKSVPVRVLNNSTIAGLAAKTGTQLSSGGWNVTETGNYPEGVVSRTTVYYGTSPQEKAAAQAIAAELGVAAEPRFAGLADSPPGVIVIVTGN
ncbi:LytR C-terminal domain-containing protein [Nocardia aurantia]|uniref:LytR/CpsA/Psr regulator C-terminal domain-containing protein n=1 Tax=Nocardia aurantia TaxID=2585199 RepID=A0A7K0DZ36_9NOCA|nr:LytR C-terminal domain-containing protein [Nocardia aurantia]MQY31080.1 hypothetical protein [Nocardia aurantia]